MRLQPAGVTISTLGALVLAFLVLPIVAVIPASFSEASYLRLPPASYSMRWYDAFAADATWIGSTLNSVKIGLLVAGVTMIMGTFAAMGLVRLSPAWRKVMTGMMLAPIIVPTIMISLALYYVMRQVGLYGSLPGLVLSHSVVCLPFVVINVGVSLSSFDRTLLLAAESLGAGPVRRFRTILLPAIWPGLIGGAIFAFATSFDDVVISMFIAGTTSKTLPIKLLEEIQLEITPVSAVASTVILVILLALFLIAQALSKYQKSGRENVDAGPKDKNGI